MGKTVARLYRQFQPAAYNLQLDIDRDKLNFKGSVTIHGKKVGRPAQRITLHQKGLKVTAATIIKHDKKGETEVKVSRINNQETLDEVRLHSDDMIYPGEYTLNLEFSGDITRPMNGMYPCFYTHDGKDKQLIATQFESHHAREAFPCVDEPEAKATFDLTLTTPAGETVLSNTPVKTESKSGSNVMTKFETTPVMSPYLLAWVFGDLKYEESRTKNGTVVRSYASPDNAQLTAYSVDVAVKVLEFFEDYFGVDYPLAKLDMVALPDFSSGAMENWGLVTYRESIMLIDEKSSSIESKQLSALVIAHELSHQWFGNLVTMKWWDDLWLNESFANMMEYLSVDAIWPEWNIWEQFVSHETAAAKRRDAIVDVQSVHTEVNHPDEISTLFDPSIVYAKGGSLLHMLMRHIGQDAFRAGLREYFQEHRYKNTEADDLWKSLSRSSGQDIKSFMDGWLHRPGYPLVTVDWEPGSPEVALEQQRFLSDPAVKTAESQPWQVPLASTFELDDQTLVRPSAKLKVFKTSKGQPFILNHDGHSYFVPRYSDSQHLQQIVDAISAGSVSAIDRLLLLDNYTMLQRGGFTATTELLDLLTGYADEHSETVWGAMAVAIGEARKLIEGDTESDAKLDVIVQKLVATIAEELGWDDADGDDAHQLRLRSLVVSIATGAKTKSFIDEGLKRFGAFEKPSELPASTRTIVLYTGARFGNDADLQKLIKLHNTSTNADERDELASALTSTRESKHHEQLIAMFKTDAIRRQDLMHWYVWMLRNRYSRAATWQWLTKEWDWIEQEFSSDKSYGFFARYCGNIFTTETELKQFQDFFGPKSSVVALSREIKLAEQEITSRVAWRQRNEAVVKQWLTDHS